MNISATKIDCYLSCPLKYRFRYIDQIEPDCIQPGLAFGSSVHRTVKFLYKRLLAGEVPDLAQVHEAFRQDWAAAQTVPIAWNGQAPDEMEKQGLAMLAAYMDAMPEPHAPLAVESEFKVPIVNLLTGEQIPDVTLHGFIDRVEAGNAPVELKTSGRSWTQAQADQSLQMCAYAYSLAFESQTDSVDGLYEIILKLKSPRVQHLVTRRTLDHFDKWFRLVSQVIDCIADARFYPSPGCLCPSCDYTAECAAW